MARPIAVESLTLDGDAGAGRPDEDTRGGFEHGLASEPERALIGHALFRLRLVDCGTTTTGVVIRPDQGAEG